MDILKNVKTLLQKYENNNVVLKKLRNHMQTQLPKLLDSYDKKIKMRELITTGSNEYIVNFMNKHVFFYISNTFIFYDNKHYQIISEDDIWSKILDDISYRYPNLKRRKYQIKNSIIRRIKENSLVGSIPESFTVQFVLDHIFPTLFDSRNLAKYFLTVLGDNILKKGKTLSHFINKDAKKFIDYINDAIQSFCKVSACRSFKYKYRDHKYSLCRVLQCNRSIKRRACWNKFIRNYILDIIVVACHYSERFKDSDGFLKKMKDPSLRKNVLFFKRKTKKDVVKGFLNKFIFHKKNESISLNNMLFLWKVYCYRERIPVLMYKDDVKTIIENLHNCKGGDFLDMSSPILKHKTRFLLFWDECITKDNNNIYEISEISNIFTDWGGKGTSIAEDMIIFILRHFFPKITIVKGRYILNIKCLIWDKKKDILSILEDLKMKYSFLNENISFINIYQDYCKCTDKYTCSKEYFEQILIDCIPNKYLHEQSVKSNFWNQ